MIAAIGNVPNDAASESELAAESCSVVDEVRHGGRLRRAPQEREDLQAE